MKGNLILEDGSAFGGELFGDSTAAGEVVFNTGMTGYQEILTDPSYCRQLVTLTYPLIGNYGTAGIFNQSRKSFVGGLIIGELCEIPSNFTVEKTLADYLRDEKIPCLYNVDTRAVTRKIRSAGTMKGVIVPADAPKNLIAELLDAPVPKDVVARVTIAEPYTLEAVNTAPKLEIVNAKDGESALAIAGQIVQSECAPANSTGRIRRYASKIDGSVRYDVHFDGRNKIRRIEIFNGERAPVKIFAFKPRGVEALTGAQIAAARNFLGLDTPTAPFVVAMDFGVKRHILDSLHNLGCRITVVPAHTTAAEILALNPDGIFLSNGPGDPKDVPEVIAEIKKLIGARPIFGICLGHQLLALAMGADTYKLKFGHRGSNQPVQNLETGRVYITSQNHGYAVDENSLAGLPLEVTYKSANDGTVEGMRHATLPIFSVQYHPEASPGPTDSTYLFDEFLELMQKEAFS